MSVWGRRGSALPPSVKAGRRTKWRGSSEVEHHGRVWKEVNKFYTEDNMKLLKEFRNTRGCYLNMLRSSTDSQNTLSPLSTCTKWRVSICNERIIFFTEKRRLPAFGLFKAHTSSLNTLNSCGSFADG